MANKTKTIEDLGREVKQRYPQYQNVSDAELGHMMLKRYPQYSRVLSVSKPSEDSPEAATEKRLTRRDKEKITAKSIIQSIASPFLKTITSGLNTASGIGALVSGKGAEEAGNRAARSRDFGFFGQDIRPVGIDEQGNAKNAGGLAKDVIGTGLELGSYGVGLPAAGVEVKAGYEAAKTGVRAGLGALSRRAGVAATEGAASGLLAGSGNELQKDGSTLKDVLTSGAGAAAAGAVLGAAAPVVGAGIRGVKNAMTGGAKNVDDIVGKVLQGKTKDIAKAKDALKLVDLKGVKTYEELGSKLKASSEALLKKQDELLGSDSTKYLINDLTEKVTVGDQSMNVNYLSEALDDLAEMYKSTGDARGLLEINQIKKNAAENGLTIKDVNTLSRRYGTEFGKKAFSKSGEPLTSVNAIKYENTRGGLKDLVSQLGGEESRQIDAQISSAINTTKLVDKMTEKVNALTQRVQKRGVLQKIGRGIGKAADVATGGVPKSIIQSWLLPSNVGLKTLNSLDLERNLTRNLRIIDKLLNMTDSEIDNTVTKSVGGGFKMATQAGKAGEKEALGIAAGFTPEKDENGNVKVTFKPENALLGMMGMSVAKKGLTKVHFDDLGTMSDFTDYVAGEYTPDLKTALQLEKDARRIAEHYGFKLVKSSDGLAFEFGKQLEKRSYAIKK